MAQPVSVTHTDLPRLIQRGKVRDIYDMGERLMIVATDRISAFDVVMSEPIPGKGAVLTRLSEFWLNKLAACQPHHLGYVVDEHTCPEGYADHVDLLRDRGDGLPQGGGAAGRVCGARLSHRRRAGREYQTSGSVSGIKLPSGLRLAQAFDEPLFTPSTKATEGHDEPISFARACEIAGADLMERARQRSLEIYQEGAAYALQRGIIIADTKFEFGVADGELILVDEVLTPDSSRFWPADEYEEGKNPPSFDKQFVRDYLNGLDWDKTPPPPTLPPEIVEKTAEKYAEALRRLVG